MVDAPNARLPKGDRWSAFDTFSWITFGEVRVAAADFEFPRQEWSRDWKRWPPEWLTFAFAEIATGVPWQPDPDEVGPFGPDNQRTWAQRIMADTGESADQLLAALMADIERYHATQDRWRQAKAAANDAIRRGKLRIWGVKAHGPSKPDKDGIPELLNPLLFTETRGVNEGGWVDWIGDGLDFVDYRGPTYDGVFFDSAEVKEAWPSSAVRQQAKIASTIAARGRLQAWLEGEMRASPNVSPSKAEMMRQAVAVGHAFSGEGFLLAWRQAVQSTGAAAWSKAGRKSKGANRKAK